jgi:hypothetical protein
MDHLHALELRLSHERVRLASATSAQEIEQRTVWVAQIEKEIDNEKSFPDMQDMPEMSDDEILSQLGI